MRIIKFNGRAGTSSNSCFIAVAKSVIGFFYSIVAHCSICFLKKETKKCKYKVSICAIFKDEGMFLKEWIEYHLLIGVEHFYLYNNFSSDCYKEVLKPYVANGFVTLIDWPIKYGQLSAYYDCYKKFSFETQWIAYIDIDEFINLKRCDNIVSWLDSFKKYPSVYIPWRMFGISGIMEHKPGTLVIEQYTSAWSDYRDIGKSIINTSYIFPEFKGQMHYFMAISPKLKFKFYPINEFKRFCYKFDYPVPLFTKDLGVVINHYFYRSYSQHLWKDYQRGDADSMENEQRSKNAQLFMRYELRNVIKEYSIQRFLTLLKVRMKGETLR